MRLLPAPGILALLLAAIVAIVAIVATAAGFGGNDSEPAAACTSTAGLSVSREGDFAKIVADVNAVPTTSSGDPRVAHLLQLECADLTGDGVDEMIVRVGQGKPAAISPWAIFRSVGGEWELALARETVGAELRVAGDGVIEAQPVFPEGANACCPSGERTGLVSWNGSAFAFTPDEGESGSERTVTSGGATVTQLGSFDPRSGAAGALTALGTPAQTVELGNSCLRQWPDLGIGIGFASYGVGEPCAGAVQSVSIGGLTGQQAGWRTGEGLALGASLAELRELYPDARRAKFGVSFPLPEPGTIYVLRNAPLYGGLRVPVLSARVEDRRVIGFDFYVGLAGE